MLGPVEDLLAVGIVPGAFLWVREDFVGGLDFGEEGGGFGNIVVIAVWVEF